MAVQIPGFGAGSDLGHMTADAIGKGVDRMSQVVIDHRVARQALFGPGFFGLELGRRYPQFVDKMAGSTAHPFRMVFGLAPIDILLVMSLGKFVGVKMLYRRRIAGGTKIDLQGLSRLVADRPFHIFILGGFAPVMAGTANLDGRAGGKFRRVNDGHPFFKNRGLGQG